ncbi:MAG: CvpA family protein [Muribaculaceae bacterium]|nr:CvpA family protein [Muribaculaceae bacterium]
MIYHLILIIVLVAAIFRGWKRGMAKQLAPLLGLAFGFVAARIFCEQAAEMLDPVIPAADTFAPAPFGEPMRHYTACMIGASLIFAVVYIVFRLLGIVLSRALNILHTGAINSIMGAAFCLAKWVLIMSILFNLWLIIRPNCDLRKFCSYGDGNLVELVMEVAPAMLGTESPSDLEHYHQMEEAHKLDAPEEA